MPDLKPNDLLRLTAEVVAAHLFHNELAMEQLPTLIQLVYRVLSTVDMPEVEPPAMYTPAVPVKRSLFPDFIICLEEARS